MSAPTMDRVNAARAAADAIRGETLAALEAGRTTTAEIIQSACLPDGAPLRRITLVRLFTGSGLHSRRFVREALRRAHTFLGEKTPGNVDRLTVMWLVDGRTDGRRIRAVSDALDRKDTAPWPGFPYAVPTKKRQSGNSTQHGANRGDMPWA